MRPGDHDPTEIRTHTDHLYSRFDALVGDVRSVGQSVDTDLGATYLALHTLRCRVRAGRLTEDGQPEPDTAIDALLLAGAEHVLYDSVRDLLPGVIELDDTEWRPEYLSSRAAATSGGTADTHRDVIARHLLFADEGVIVAPESDIGHLDDVLRTTMLAASGAALDAALMELGWRAMLTDTPDVAVPLVFRLLGETGSHASLLVDVVLHATGNEIGGTLELPLPYAGNAWVVWDRTEHPDTGATLGGLPLRREDEGYPIRLAEARRAVGWWLVGASRAMLALTRRHAADRTLTDPVLARRLVETLVAIAGAEATLTLPGDDNPDLTALLAKAAAGRAALTAAEHCRRILAGIGVTGERNFDEHVQRVLVLDGLLGSSRELTRRAGAGLRARGSVPRLAEL